MGRRSKAEGHPHVTLKDFLYFTIQASGAALGSK
jgi:hypothetical protein